MIFFVDGVSSPMLKSSAFSQARTFILQLMWLSGRLFLSSRGRGIKPCKTLNLEEVPVVEANIASGRIDKARNQRLVSAFCAFLGALKILRYCPEYTQCLSAQFLLDNIKFVLCTLCHVE